VGVPASQQEELQALRGPLSTPQQLGDKIKAMIEDMARELKIAAERAEPNKLSAQFTIGFSGKFGVPVLVEAGAELGLTAGMEWELKKS
jgi:hypothetical protein